MANEEHKALAQFIKSVHSSLRSSSATIGAEKAWVKHCENVDVLKQYAHFMQKLAVTHWQVNCEDGTSEATSRIKWAADFCYDYFTNVTRTVYRDREIDIARKINIYIAIEEHFHKPYKLLDVGSCYNPFRIYDFLDVLPIDLCPANESVLQCDFLNVKIDLNTIIEKKKIIEIKRSSIDILTFCFVLEYIPNSKLRLDACKRAYQVLKEGGLMIITTPDSKHVGANSKIMKNWRYTLACIGFNRIKYEKLPHMHCMAFRKSLHIDIARRWALLHKEEYMEMALHIPQDFQTVCENVNKTNIDSDTINMTDDFINMPFFHIFMEHD